MTTHKYWKYVENKFVGATSQDFYRFYQSDGATSRDFYSKYVEKRQHNKNMSKNQRSSLVNMSKSYRVCQKYVEILPRMSRISVARIYIYLFIDANKSRISDSIARHIVFSRARSFDIDGFRIARRFVLEKSETHKSVFRLEFIAKMIKVCFDACFSLSLYIYIYQYQYL